MKPIHKKRFIQIALLVATAISLTLVPWPIVIAWITPLPQSIQEQVDEASNYGFEGIITYVDIKGKRPEYYTSGYKNREMKTPANPHDLFKIASVGKLYTAVAITKLAYQNRLSLNETLADYFPELVNRIENANTITIQMMVRHRTGIPDYTRINNYWAHPKDNDTDRLDIVLDRPAHFEPDSDFEYSNTNYLLLGKIIEKVTGMSKFKYIKQTILDPHGLKNTYGSIHDVDLDRVMSGYYVGYENDLKTDDNGFMLATAADLGTFIRALNEGSVFENSDEQELYKSLYKLEHTGMMPGYQTIAKYHSDIDAVVIQFTNTTNFDGYHWNLSKIMYNRVIKIIKDEN